MKHETLSSPRPLIDLDGDASGQLATEWVMVTTVVVVPLVLLIPAMFRWLHLYFYRVAEVVSLPFP